MGMLDVNGMLARMTSSEFTGWAAWMMENRIYTYPATPVKQATVTKARKERQKTPEDIWQALKTGLSFHGIKAVKK